jgi:hypothetical protein
MTTEKTDASSFCSRVDDGGALRRGIRGRRPRLQRETNSAASERRTRPGSSMSKLATRGVCAARQAVMADPMERQGVTRSMHHARRKKLSRHGASAAGKSEELVRENQAGCFTAEGAENAARPALPTQRH